VDCTSIVRAGLGTRRVPSDISQEKDMDNEDMDPVEINSLYFLGIHTSKPTLTRSQ
jgi:hypothetical protein